MNMVVSSLIRGLWVCWATFLSDFWCKVRQIIPTPEIKTLLFIWYTSKYNYLQVNTSIRTSLYKFTPIFSLRTNKKREPALLIPSYSFSECNYFTCRFQFDSDFIYMPKSWSTFQRGLLFEMSEIFLSCTNWFTLLVICCGFAPCINLAKALASSSLL